LAARDRTGSLCIGPISGASQCPRSWGLCPSAVDYR